MTRWWTLVAALGATVVAGCGGTMPEEAQAEVGSPKFGQVASELRCTARCAYGPDIGCDGAVCSAVDYSHVQCDGSTSYCPAPPSCPAAGQFYHNIETLIPPERDKFELTVCRPQGSGRCSINVDVTVTGTAIYTGAPATQVFQTVILKDWDCIIPVRFGRGWTNWTSSAITSVSCSSC
jgi:hypothetical protein